MKEFSVDSVYAAFSKAPRPNEVEIALHQCCECDEIRKEFSKYSVRDVANKVVSYHGDCIPLLSPMAFRYYMPRYMEFTFYDKEHITADNLLFNLSPDNIESDFWRDRCNEFTIAESKSIILYLLERRKWEDADFDEEWIAPGIEYWKKLITRIRITDGKAAV